MPRAQERTATVPVAPGTSLLESTWLPPASLHPASTLNPAAVPYDRNILIGAPAVRTDLPPLPPELARTAPDAMPDLGLKTEAHSPTAPVPPWPGGWTTEGYIPPLDGAPVASRFRDEGLVKWLNGDPMLPVLRAAAAYGIDTMYRGPFQDRFARNHPSVSKDALMAYITKGLNDGSVLGPFSSIDAARRAAWPSSGSGPLHCNPRATVYKDGKKPRLVDDKSFGYDKSINAWIDLSDQRTVRFDRLPQLTALIQDARRKYPGQQLLGWKLDIEGAFRHLVLREVDRWLGLMTADQRTWFLDIACSFGLRSSVFWWCLFSAAISRAGTRHGVPNVCYMDDSAGVGVEADNLAVRQRNLLIRIIVDCGLPISLKKFLEEATPAPVFDFTGYVCDLIKFEYRITRERLDEVLGLAESILARGKATGKELAKLIGKLIFVNGVVLHGYGALFTLHLNNDLQGLQRLHHHCRLSSGARADLEWWVEFLPQLNGIASIPEVERPEVDWFFASDASDQMWGWHICLPGRRGVYAHNAWPEGTSDDIDINVRELATVYMAVASLESELAHRRVRMYIDNQATVCWLRGWRSRSGPAAVIMRALVPILLRADIKIEPVYISTHDNLPADLLSRDQAAAFLRLVQSERYTSKIGSASWVRRQVPLRLRTPWLPEC